VRAYAGIGSRETPPDVLELMGALAYRLAEGWTLRTGAADGADSAFEEGHVAAAGVSGLEVYLPWPGFNGHDDLGVARFEPQLQAFDIASSFHPAWDRCSRGAQALHARNVHQVLGRDVDLADPVKFVVCWTRGGAGGGGTGQALRIARHYHVPIYDLARSDHRTRVESFLQ
jgi:hypothetical protein